MRLIEQLVRILCSAARAYENALSSGDDEPVCLPTARVYCDRRVSPTWRPQPHMVIRHGAQQ